VDGVAIVVGDVYVARAGWSLARTEQPWFPDGESHLARYAQRLPAVEINSSFYRPHRPSTYARWAAAVPQGFRFSVKAPRAITHERRLANVEGLLDQFLGAVAVLGARLGCLLVQLPPSLTFEARVVSSFFASLRARFGGAVVVEPRHASWFSPAVDRLLVAFRVGRVAADPACVEGARRPGGWPALAYYRLHGTPRMYYSAYDDAYLAALVSRLSADSRSGATVWCVFDNTARGAATKNALSLIRRLTEGAEGTDRALNDEHVSDHGIGRASDTAAAVRPPRRSDGVSAGIWGASSGGRR
jgi:uncharacterized protein YecE (DUF72 family)